MVEKTTRIHCYWHRWLLLFWLAAAFTARPAYAQGPTGCSELTIADITTDPATCEGNGTITAPAFDGATYTLSGGAISGEVPQSSNVFESLNPGTYTLKVLCEGSSTPIEIQNIVVEDRHEQLALDLTAEMLCPDEGKITATATNGHNLGVEAGYRFAIWPASEGGANRPDNEVSYGGVDPDGVVVFENLAAGTYFVRVMDNCDNYWTQTISIAPSAPNINLGHSAAWVCVDGALVRRVRVTLGADYRSLGYEYKVEAVAGTSNCAIQEASAVIVDQKPISTASDEFDIPAGVTAYRITTISPCGTQSTSCQSVPENTINMTFRRSLLCAPGEGNLARVTYQVSGNNYTISYPGTLQITGTGYSKSVAVASSGDLSGILTDVPRNAFPLSITFTDACGATRTMSIDTPGDGTGNPSFPSHSYSRQCVDFGHTDVTVTLNGNYIGVGQEGTTYKLQRLDAENNVVEEFDGTLANSILNQVRFQNVPAGHTYRILITPSSTGEGTDCGGPQTTGTLAIGAGNGFHITSNPVITKVCNDGTNSWSWGLTHNASGLSGGNLFEIFDNLEMSGTPVRSTTASTTPIIIEPGEYYWRITFGFPNSCTRSVTGGPVVVEAWQVNPAIDKSLAVTCQNEEGEIQPFGNAVLEFSGYGPFRIESREGTSGPFVLVPGAGSVTGPTYAIPNLENGKTYSFRIVDQCGKTVTQQVIVKPLSPRIIVYGLQPCDGQPYTLSGVDYPGASYEWTRNGTVVGTSKDLVFDSFGPGDEGQYKLKLTILDGCVVREATVNLELGNCNQPFQLGSLGDYVWYDLNYNGLQDGDEPAVEGVPVALEAYIGPPSPTSEQLATPANWTEIDQTVTDANGLYKFEQLETGYYRVRFGDVPGYVYTTHQAGGTDADNRGNGNDSNAGEGGYSGPVYIDANDSETLNARHNMTIDAGLVAYGSIGDYVWLDNDLDGLQGNPSAEPPVAGVTVNLYKKDGDSWPSVPIATTTTDLNGRYLFDELESGIYQVEFVIPEEMNREFALQYVNGESNTEPADSDAHRVTGRSGEIVIETFFVPSGDIRRDNMTIDAGLIPAGALPVKLARFNALKTGEGTSLLTWSTTEEVNSSVFVVLQSIDGQNWKPIGEVEAKGNSTRETAYTFVDGKPYRGVNYYRLKIVDIDGSFELSNIRSLTFDGAAVALKLYPNPVSDYLKIGTESRENISRVEIFDANGRLVLTDSQAAGKEKVIQVKGLSAGTYVLKIMLDNGARELRKVVIVR